MRRILTLGIALIVLQLVLEMPPVMSVLLTLLILMMMK